MSRLIFVGTIFLAILGFAMIVLVMTAGVLFLSDNFDKLTNKEI